MKRHSIIASLLTAMLMLGMTACENDDTNDFTAYINNQVTPENPEEPTEQDTIKHDSILVAGSDTLYIVYNGTTAEVTNDTHGYATVNGADVTINALEADTTMLLVVSGSTDDGSLLIYRQKSFTLRLNGVSITNPDGPAINNQCSKWLYVDVADGTENVLTDGESYAEQTFDQKGTFFSEGQMHFFGTGTLTVNGKAKNGIASDDYIIIDAGKLVIDVKSDGGRGIKVNDGLTINGGNTTITTSGDCKIETKDGVKDTTSAAGIKSDSTFVMTGGTLTIKSTGDGGKGINSSKDVTFSGGTLNVTTTGSNEVSKPKGIKSDTGIIVSGGSFTVKVAKSWACDNGYEDSSLSDSQLAQLRLTVQGSPATKSIAKKSVIIKY